MKLYRKQAIVVEAVQYIAPDAETGRATNEPDIAAWGAPVAPGTDGDMRLQLMTSNGHIALVSHDDWVIKEPDDSGFYPCSDAVFHLTHVALDDGDAGAAPTPSETPSAVDTTDAEKEELRLQVEQMDATLTAKQDEIVLLNTRLNDAIIAATSNGLDGIAHERVPLLVEEEHKIDKAGNPAGGETIGTGLTITWQRGPLVDPATGDRIAPNGAFVEAVIQAAIGRIEFYELSKFACKENADALDHLYAALARLNDRTRDRETRGVEGTHAQ